LILVESDNSKDVIRPPIGRNTISVYIESVVTAGTLIRIDYIFHEPQFRALESRVLPDTGASDHYPIYTVLEIDLP
jgi:endonuclease/exonuclease/phosphatase family metal-dependent hydrolase